jgi:hypothetical protein
MSIVLHPDLEARLRRRAETAGVTIDEYVEGLVRADQEAEDELESLAIEGCAQARPSQPETSIGRASIVVWTGVSMRMARSAAAMRSASQGRFGL